MLNANGAANRRGILEEGYSVETSVLHSNTSYAPVLFIIIMQQINQLSTIYMGVIN